TESAFLFTDLSLFCFTCTRLFYLHDSSLLHRNTTVFIISELYDHIFFCDIDHYSVKSTCRQNSISNFHISDHRRYPLLLFLLRSHQNEPESAKNNYIKKDQKQRV